MERELRQILGAADDGKGLNSIVDQFRRGRDAKDVVPALDSSDSDLVSVGAWILGELPVELYDSHELVSRLRKLIDHDDPAVRFHAFGALFPVLDWKHESTRELLLRLQRDSNEGVRRSAEAAIAQLTSR
ncbi:MAG: HEAT repeat domain-containing protein [Planctomycetes bacterium]|nr:HEAT repeat domain-containing protein [Planctomycetota bacterium]